MMVFCCILLLQTAPAFAVRDSILVSSRDSLQAILASYDNQPRMFTQSDTALVRCLDALAWQFWRIQPQKALGYAQRALSVAQQIHDQQGIVNAYFSLGNIYRQMDNEQSAIESYTKQRELAYELHQNDLAGRALNGIALMYQKRGKYDQALQYHLEHLRFREQIGDSIGMLRPYLNIGELYRDQGQYEVALEYLLKGLDIVQHQRNQQGPMGRIFNNIAEVYKLTGKYERAVEFAEKSHHAALEAGDKETQAEALTCMGDVQRLRSGAGLQDDANRQKAALKYYFQALALLREMGYDDGFSSLLYDIGTVYCQQKKYTESLRYAERALTQSTNSSKNDRKAAYELLAEAYSGLGKSDSALRAFRQAVAVRDSIFSETSAYRIEQLQAQYNSEHKDKEIQLLQNDKHRQTLLLYTIVIGVSLLALLALALYSRYRLRLRTKRQLGESQSMLTQVQNLSKTAGFELDIITNMMRWTEYFLTITERSSESLVHSKDGFLELLHVQDVSDVRQFFTDLAANSPVKSSVECRLLTTDGRIKYIRIGGVLSSNSIDGKNIILGFLQDVTESIVAKNILSGTRSLLSGITNSSLDGIMTFVSVRSANGVIVDFQWTLINPAAERILGVSGNELITKRLLREIPDNPLAALFERYVQVIETGTPIQFEYPWVLNETTFWLYVALVKLGDGLVVTFADISARKRAVEDLILSERKLTALFNSSHNAYILLGVRQEILAFNIIAANGIRRQFGRNVLVGEYMRDYIQPALLQVHDAWFQRAAQGETVVEDVAFTSPRGTNVWYAVKYTPVTDEHGAFWGVALSMENINKRKVAEERLRTSEELYRKLVEASPDAVSLIDLEGRLLSANQRHAEMFGFTLPSELKNIPTQEFMAFSKHEHFANVLKTLRQGIPVPTIEMESVNNEGTVIITENQFVLLRDSHDNPASILVVSRDVTERKHFEDQMIAAKEAADAANRTKSEFIANISHEIRTPMNAILGFADILREQVGDFMLDSYIQGISVAANNLLNLINDVLDISKIEAGRLDIRYEPVNPYKLFVELQQTFFVKAQQKDLEFVIEASPNLPEVLLLDEIRLRQILLNLLGNAVKFTDEGFIKLRVDATNAARHIKSSEGFSDGTKILSQAPSQAAVEHEVVDLTFTVSDSGIGIPENQYELIFEPFRQQEGQDTRRYEGTGLGLTICKRLTEMMNGTIRLESEVGKGSSFIVQFNNVQVMTAFDQQLITTDYAPSPLAIAPSLMITNNNHIIKTPTITPDADRNVAVPTMSPELLTLLEGEVMDLWKNIEQMMINTDIEIFAERLIQLGKQFNVTELEHYGKDLYMKSVSFKIAEMTIMFEEFPLFVQRLKTSTDA